MGQDSAAAVSGATSELHRALGEAVVISEPAIGGGLCFGANAEELGFVADRRCFENPLSFFVSLGAMAPSTSPDFWDITVVMAVLTPDVNMTAVVHRGESVPHRVVGQVLLFGLEDLQDLADVTVEFAVAGREGSCTILRTDPTCDVSDLR